MGSVLVIVLVANTVTAHAWQLVFGLIETGLMWRMAGGAEAAGRIQAGRPHYPLQDTWRARIG